MNVSALIELILNEWAYRVNDGMPNPKNPTHLKELGVVLSEMGLSHIKKQLIENLLTEKGKTPEEVKEADGDFKNPILNKKVNYKNAKGEDTDGLVGNLLRLPADHPGRKAAERLLPPEGSDERDALNKDLGGQNQPQKPEDGKEKQGGEEEGGAPQEDPIQKAAQMFDPKVDPAMAARLEKEKETLAQIAGDKEETPSKEEPEKKDDGFNPIPSVDVQKEMPEADPETFGGASDIPDGIDKEDLEKFNTDITKVKQIVDDAKAKGEKAPNINLCQITVPGTNLYCDDNLGIPREEMPQFKGTAQPGSRAADMPVDKSGEVDTEPVFREMLKEKGIKVTQTEVPADKLKATQSELVGAKVVGMMGALEENPEHPSITAPIYVSRDGFVIDGHHRWAAIAAYNASHPDSQIPMKVQVIDQDIKDAIPMANKFAEDMGIAAKKADANKESPTEQSSEPAKREPANDDPESKAQQFKGKSSGENIQTMEMEGGGFVYGTKHDNTSMVDDILDDVKSKIPKERWKDIVFVGEGGMPNDEGGIDFNGEQDYAKQQFEKLGATSDTWDGEETNVFDNQSPLYKYQEEQTGLSNEEVMAANWASMIGQGDSIEDMSPEDYLTDSGKEFLQQSAKEANLPLSDQWDSNPTDDDIDTLYRLSFAEDNNDVKTKVNDAQESFNKFRDVNLLRKNKELTAQGKIPITIAGESHVELVDKMTRKDKNETYQMKEQHLSLVDRLIENIIEGFIEEADRDWKLAARKGGPDGKIVYFGSKEKKKAALQAGSHIDVDKNLNAKGGAAAQPPAKKLGAGDFRQTKDLTAQPTPQPTSQPKKKKKKNKELNQKTNTKKNFNEGYFAQDGITDKEFKNNPKVKPTAKQMNIKDLIPFLVDKNGNTNFPKKYLKVLHRLLNTKGGSGLTISDFTDASGAGTLSSTMGELMTLMAVTIKDEAKANQFFNMIGEHVKANGKDSIIDIGWVKSAQKVRETLFKRYDRAFGKGKWELEQMAWDIESEVEGLGLENYKENKGFSTDVYAKVKVNGQSVLDEISLKKELTANLLNATSNRVQDIMVRGAANDEDLKIYDDLNTKIDALAGLKDKESVAERKKLIAERDAMIEKYNAKVPDEAKVSYAQKKQRELHQDFIKSGEKEVKEFLNKFCGNNKKYRENSAKVIKNQLNQKEDYINQVTQKISAVCKEVKRGKSYAEALVGLEKADYQKLNLAIMSAIAAENPKSKAAKSYKSIIENSHNHSKAVRDFLLKDPNARKGLFASIREAFPLKALFEGEENMILGDVSADKQVLSDVFGVNSFEELEQKLTIRDTPPPPSIVYRVAGKEDIPVAEISSRPDGIGYGGTWKLEMKVHPEFGKKLKESNSKLNV